MSVTDHKISDMVAPLESVFIHAATEIFDKYVELLPEEQLLFLCHSGRRSAPDSLQFEVSDLGQPNKSH